MRNGQKCWTSFWTFFYCAPKQPMVIINAHTSLTNFAAYFFLLLFLCLFSARVCFIRFWSSQFLFIYISFFLHSVYFLVLNKEELSGYWICNANYMRFTCKLFWNNSHALSVKWTILKAFALKMSGAEEEEEGELKWKNSYLSPET